MIDRYFPDTAWLRLGRDSFERLRAYRARHTLLTWEQAIDRLLDDADG
jgi:predicted alpha-1,6-mannanase (GH76 family)